MQFEAAVTDIRLESRIQGKSRWQLALTNTLFSVANQRGTLTAVSAGGTRLEVPVLGIVEEAGTFWHIVEKPLAEGTSILGEPLCRT